MGIDQQVSRSRRAVLAAGLGGVITSVASAFGRPASVRAGTDGDVVLGGDNSTTNTTIIRNTSSDIKFADAFLATAGIGAYAVTGQAQAGIGVAGSAGTGTGTSGSSTSGYGVWGSSSSNHGVHGSSDTSYGVYGTSTSNAAIYGETSNHPGVIGHSDNTIGVSGISPNGSGVAGSSGIGIGVVGSSNATNQAGIRGSSGGDATGVLGYSGPSLPGTAPAKTGVYGEATQDAAARGVWGASTRGRGVYGEATSGFGVRGYATTSGTGVHASVGALKKGLALHAVGRVKLDNSAGLATITSGTKSVVVAPGIDLQATSAVVATLQGNPGGTTAVQRVEVDAAADTFTIFLTANATSTVSVAWHVFG